MILEKIQQKEWVLNTLKFLYENKEDYKKLPEKHIIYLDRDKKDYIVFPIIRNAQRISAEMHRNEQKLIFYYYDNIIYLGRLKLYEWLQKLLLWSSIEELEQLEKILQGGAEQ